MKRAKFLSPHLRIRKEALERAWDAWERLKTVKDADKKQGTRALLDVCSSEPKMREILEAEARLLTDFGNRFHIRHSETNQSSITDEAHVDYAFPRNFAMLLLVLRKHDMLKSSNRSHRRALIEFLLPQAMPRCLAAIAVINRLA